jgi:hypothetical protein
VCIGGRNLKGFILFCLYGGMFSGQFLVCECYLCYGMIFGGVERMEVGNMAILVIFGLLGIFLSIVLWCLGVRNCMMVCRNITYM